MSQLNETFSQPAPQNKKAGWIALGIASAVVVGMLYGPSFKRSYEDGQAIEHKSGPAKAYVAKTLGELVLDGERLDFTVGNHECDEGAHYGPGDVARHCQVHGRATYAFKAKDFSSAHSKASDLLRQHKVGRGEHTIAYQGQNLDVDVDFTLRSGPAYNNSLEHGDAERKAPNDDYVVQYDVAAYTVNFDPPKYLYNNDNP